MTNKMQKEQFSRAYVQAVAACAGFSWSVPSVDDDSEGSDGYVGEADYDSSAE